MPRTAPVLDYSALPPTELVIEAEPGAVRITVPPPTGAARVMVLITASIALAGLVSLMSFAGWFFLKLAADVGELRVIVGGLTVFALVFCILWITSMLNHLARPTIFEVRDGRFRVTSPSMFGSSRHEWPAEAVGYLSARWGQIRLTRTGAMQMRFLRWCSYRKLTTIIASLQRAYAEEVVTFAAMPSRSGGGG